MRRINRGVQWLFIFSIEGCSPQPFYGIDFDGDPWAEADAAIDAGRGGAAADDAGLTGAIVIDASATVPDGAVDGDATAIGPPAVGVGGARGSGGSSGSGDADASGTVDTSDAGATASGGAPSGGAPSGGMGGAVDSCVPTMHDNGAGQSWRDCVPLGTLSVPQARKACAAWCSGGRCVGACAFGSVCGKTMVLNGISSSGTELIRGWAIDGTTSTVDLGQQVCTPTGMWD